MSDLEESTIHDVGIKESAVSSQAKRVIQKNLKLWNERIDEQFTKVLVTPSEIKPLTGLKK